MWFYNMFFWDKKREIDPFLEVNKVHVRKIQIGDVYITDLSGWSIPLTEEWCEFKRMKVINIQNDGSRVVFKYVTFHGKKDNFTMEHDSDVVNKMILESYIGTGNNYV